MNYYMDSLRIGQVMRTCCCCYIFHLLFVVLIISFASPVSCGQFAVGVVVVILNKDMNDHPTQIEIEDAISTDTHRRRERDELMRKYRKTNINYSMDKEGGKIAW